MLYPEAFGTDPQFPDAADFAVVNIDDSVGKGVITYRAFKKGSVLAKMSGVKMPTVSQHSLEINLFEHNYDPYFSGYFLHACSPNISLNMETMLVTALQDIQANEYLTMDYAETESVLFKQFACQCGHLNCRQWVTGNQESQSAGPSNNVGAFGDFSGEYLESAEAI